MRIALVTVVYENSVKKLYESHPGLNDRSYLSQKEIVDKVISTWTSGWENALIKKGWDVISIPINVNPLQFKWAEENDFNSNDIHEIAFKQISKFKPDVLWYDYFDIPLLKKIKSGLNNIKLFLGWTGSSVVDLNILREANLVLSCAPETVDKLNEIGIKSIHLNHAFNPVLLKNIEEKQINYNFTFIGQIFRGKGLHTKREELLKLLVKNLDLTIFSPSYYYGLNKILITALKKISYAVVAPLLKTNWIQKEIMRNSYLREIIRSGNSALMPYDPVLRRKMKPPVYGSEMYDTIFKSLIVLNIHADSSPEYASNMRLFETTGVGTCLLTDWKKNIDELFKEDSEIVTYKTDNECLEKAKWILSNPKISFEIGKAGQGRTLRNHTYDNRVEELLEIINKQL